MIEEEAEVVVDWLEVQLGFLCDHVIRLVAIPWLFGVMVVIIVLQVVARQVVLEIEWGAQELECSTVVLYVLCLRLSGPRGGDRINNNWHEVFLRMGLVPPLPCVRVMEVVVVELWIGQVSEVVVPVVGAWTAKVVLNVIAIVLITKGKRVIMGVVGLGTLVLGRHK